MCDCKPVIAVRYITNNVLEKLQAEVNYLIGKGDWQPVGPIVKITEGRAGLRGALPFFGQTMFRYSSEDQP